MLVFRYARHVRAKEIGKAWPKWIRVPLSLLLKPVEAMQFVVGFFVLVAVAFIALRLFWSAGGLWHAFRKASISDTGHSRRIKGGEVRHTGFQKTISTTRHGESARSGDLRRRLNELRSMRTGAMNHTTSCRRTS